MAKSIHIQLSIPEPCQVPWNSMSPVDEMRRHCDSCEKVVIDFRRMSDDELVSFFSKPQGNICGRLLPSQINKPMLALPVKTQKANWWKSLLLLPLVFFSKQVKAQYEYSRAIANGDSALLAKQDSSSSETKTVAANDSVSVNDSLRVKITATAIPMDSNYKFAWKPYLFSVWSDSIQPYPWSVLGTGGTIVSLVTIEPPTIQVLAGDGPCVLPWQPWQVVYPEINGNICLVPIAAPDYGNPNPFIKPIANTMPREEYEKIYPIEKLKNYPIWEKLYSRLENLRTWLGLKPAVYEAKIDLSLPDFRLSEKPEEKPEAPKPGTPSSDYSIAVLPDARKNFRK